MAGETISNLGLRLVIDGSGNGTLSQGTGFVYPWTITGSISVSNTWNTALTRMYIMVYIVNESGEKTTYTKVAQFNKTLDIAANSNETVTLSSLSANASEQFNNSTNYGIVIFYGPASTLKCSTMVKALGGTWANPGNGSFYSLEVGTGEGGIQQPEQ